MAIKTELCSDFSMGLSESEAKWLLEEYKTMSDADIEWDIRNAFVFRPYTGSEVREALAFLVLHCY